MQFRLVADHAAEGEPVVPVVLERGPNTTRMEGQVVPVGSGGRNSTRQFESSE